jgi:hypothetical protein
MQKEGKMSYSSIRLVDRIKQDDVPSFTMKFVFFDTLEIKPQWTLKNMYYKEELDSFCSSRSFNIRLLISAIAAVRLAEYFRKRSC